MESSPYAGGSPSNLFYLLGGYFHFTPPPLSNKITSQTMASTSASASASSSEKVWQQDILDDSAVENVNELKGLWIYCQVCTKKINMKYPFRGSRWN
jgi:hypothetical protein